MQPKFTSKALRRNDLDENLSAPHFGDAKDDHRSFTPS
jgi:hypothetical protein